VLARNDVVGPGLDEAITELAVSVEARENSLR
jgi:hypothetical protein